jgi:hypothetical protein
MLAHRDLLWRERTTEGMQKVPSVNQRFVTLRSTSEALTDILLNSHCEPLVLQWLCSVLSSLNPQGSRFPVLISDSISQSGVNKANSDMRILMMSLLFLNGPIMGPGWPVYWFRFRTDVSIGLLFYSSPNHARIINRNGILTRIHG